MSDGVADLGAESVQDDLAHDEKEDAKSNITQRPAILKGSHDQQDLHADIYEELDGIQQIQHDKQADGFCRAHAGY